MRSSHPISIVIVSWNTRDVLRLCLRSIFSRNALAVDQVIVIDNASSDDSPEMVRAEFSSVRLVANAENVGFAAANNQGMKLCNSKYYLLLNPDTEATPEDLQKSLEILEGNARIGVLGVRLQHEDGSLQENCFHFPTVWLNLINNLGLYRFFSSRWKSERILNEFFAHDTARQVDWVMGAFMFVRRRAIEKAGGD
jgi:hypothetical protein